MPRRIKLDTTRDKQAELDSLRTMLAFRSVMPQHVADETDARILALTITLDQAA